MRVRWTPEAAGDLVQIAEYIPSDSPRAAQRVALAIYSAIAALRKSPYLGRRGLVEGTREILITPWPYIVVYESHAAAGGDPSSAARFEGLPQVSTEAAIART